MQDETARVEEVLLEKSASDRLVRCFVQASGISFEGILDSYVVDCLLLWGDQADPSPSPQLPQDFPPVLITHHVPVHPDILPPSVRRAINQVQGRGEAQPPTYHPRGMRASPGPSYSGREVLAGEYRGQAGEAGRGDPSPGIGEGDSPNSALWRGYLVELRRGRYGGYGGEIRRWDWIGFWRGGKWRSGRKDGDGVGREKDQLDEENDERERRGCGVVSREAGAGTSAHKRRDAGKGEGRQASSDCRQGIGREC